MQLSTRERDLSEPPTAVIIQGGGMRNAYATGFLSGAELTADSIDGVFAFSSAVPAAAYFITGQQPEAERIWIEELTRAEVFSWKSFLFLQYSADVDFLINQCCESLSFERLRDSNCVLFVPLARNVSGRIIYLRSDEEDLSPLFKAAGASPGVSGGVELNRERFFDGGLGIGTSIKEARARGFSKLLILLNLSDANRKIQIETEENMFVVRPKEQLPASRFSRSSEEVRDTIEVGRALGRELKDDVQAFLRWNQDRLA